MSDSSIFIDNLDKEKFSKGIEVIKQDKVYLEDISNKLTEEFTKGLDKLMKETYLLIKQNELDDNEMEIRFLELTNHLYFMGDKLESLGIELTVSSSRNKEVFNRLYQQSTGTIPERKAVAEEGSKYESLMEAIYESVYKRIKAKIDAGYEMVSSLKRIIMKRVAEIGLQGQRISAEPQKRKKSAYEGD